MWHFDETYKCHDVPVPGDWLDIIEKLTDRRCSARTHHLDNDWPNESMFELVFSSNIALANEIADFLATPSELVNVFCRASGQFAVHTSQHVLHSQWRRLYAHRWPTFADHASQVLQTADWRSLYRDTLSGRHEALLEVFDRQKKQGFAMSSSCAQVRYDQRLECFIATYVSASQAPPEQIPLSEEHRLRCCPMSVREQLVQETTSPDEWPASPFSTLLKQRLKRPADLYPYLVYRGGEGELRIGQGIEFQWKMQPGSPFAWWYGTVEFISFDSSKLAYVSILFKHFPADSRWYRLDVTVGDGAIRSCAMGGYHGGVRGVSEGETKRWMRYFPREPLAL